MLEQAVARVGSERIRRLKKVLRGLQIFVLSMLVLGEVFGMMLSRVYYETDMIAFRQWIAMMILFGVPMVLAALALELPLRHYSTEYDYELQGQSFTVYKLVYGRRKWLLSVDLHSVLELSPYRWRGKERGMICAFCNMGSEDLVRMVSNNCFTKRGTNRSVIILEPDKEMKAALAKECGSVSAL